MKLRNIFIAAGTIIGRGLSFWFLVLKRDFYYKEKQFQQIVQKYWFLYHPRRKFRVFF